MGTIQTQTKRNTTMENFKNQAAMFIHLQIRDDEAYRYSVASNCLFNMQLVLRAYGEDHSTEDAENQMEAANLLGDK